MVCEIIWIESAKRSFLASKKNLTAPQEVGIVTTKVFVYA